MSEYQAVIGLEVHAQLKTKTKLFCSCLRNSKQVPNRHVCPVCLGLPGALPVINQQAVILAVRSGLALQCNIAEHSVFSRKNYVYPDLPKGYQISQFDKPLCTTGKLTIMGLEQPEKTIGITRIHMEEDAGKLVHQGADAIAGAMGAHVDLNRAGTPLIEIVSEPDIRSAAEARCYAEKLHLLLMHIDVCDGNMDAGNLRIDANVSIRQVGTTTFGTRTEVKNLNSFRSLERAIDYEIARQTQCLNVGEVLVQQTRHYDDATGKTVVLRDKEDSHDYRYFPEPDLKPLLITCDEIDAIGQAMPDLPEKKRNYYQSELGLGVQEINVLLQDYALNQYFENCLQHRETLPVALISKWLVGDFTAYLKEKAHSFADTQVSSNQFLVLLTHIHSGKISGKMAKTILRTMVNTGKDPDTLLTDVGGEQISDEDTLSSVVSQVVQANSDVVAKIKAGKTESMNYLMGQVMRETKGRAKPDTVRQLIHDAIHVH